MVRIEWACDEFLIISKSQISEILGQLYYDQLYLLGNVGQTVFQSNSSDHADQVSRKEQRDKLKLNFRLSLVYISLNYEIQVQG